jgi:hypothetical protein
MKPRKVIITIEAKSDAPLKEIRDHYNTNVQLIFNDIDVHQVSVQVVKEEG